MHSETNHSPWRARLASSPGGDPARSHYSGTCIDAGEPDAVAHLRFSSLDGCRIGGVLVNVHDPWHRIARCFYGFNQEAFRCRSIPLSRQQKLDRLAIGVDRTVGVPVLALDPYVGLVYPVGFVVGRRCGWQRLLSSGAYA